MPFLFSTWVFFKFVALIIDHLNLGTNTTHYLQTNCVLCNQELWLVYKHHLFFEYVSSCCFLLLLAFLFIGILYYPPPLPSFRRVDRDIPLMRPWWVGSPCRWCQRKHRSCVSWWSTLAFPRKCSPERLWQKKNWMLLPCLFFLRRCCRERWIDRDIEVHWFDVDLDDLL